MKQKQLKNEKEKNEQQITKKKTTSRSKKAYPNLDRSLNLKSRRYFIESAEYINGVYDGEKQLIRPLSEEELCFLNKFNEGFINATIPEDSIFLTDSTEVDKMKDDLAKLIKKKKTSRKRLDKKNIVRDIVKLKSEIYYLDPKKYLYGANNSRNRDLYTMYQATGSLIEVDPIIFDRLTYKNLWDFVEDQDYVSVLHNEDIRGENSSDESVSEIVLEVKK